MNKPCILIVEDDRAVRNLLSTTLETQGYSYRTAETGAASIMEALSCRPDLIILDLGLPDMDGVDIIKKIRGWSSVPIVVVSARCEDRDKIEALDAGADDYLTKPFSVDELLARLRVALRRNPNEESSDKRDAIFENGSLKIDYSAGCAYVDGAEIHLTPIEYKLLRLLSQNVGKMLTHNFILKEVWGAGAMQSDVPSLRVFMATLRKKIEADTSRPQFIQTHIGVGYRMLRIPDEVVSD
jgi:two-component system KDP operon response regulator KdpE